MVHLLRQHQRCSGAQGAFAATAPAHRQPFLPVDAEQSFVVQPDPFPRQQDVQATIAKPSPLRRQFAQSLADRAVVRSARTVAVGLRVQADQSTRTALRVALLVNRPAHGLPPQARRQKFFPSISRSVATSSIDSASSFFSFRFSSSRPFSLRASDTSMPPYFVRHL